MKRSNKKRCAVMLCAAAVTAVSALTVLADAAPDGMTVASQTEAAANGAYESWQQKWSTLSSDWTQVSLTPGSDETQMNFAWYSKTGESVSFSYGETEECSLIAEVTQSDAQEGYKSNKVTLSGLKANTTYYYKVSGKEVESFDTKDSSSFSFIFVGDPQIGSSNSEKAKSPEDIAKDSFAQAQYDSVENDAFNWNNTLNMAYEKAEGNASFVLSAGDQIQTNAQKVGDNTVSEIEYAGYLSPEILWSLPVATTVGNHDADNPNYLYHFNVPNLSELGSNEYVGGDYSFTYGSALFIMLNTQDTNSAEHGQFIKESVEANPDAQWIIVSLHQDIYGSAEHSNEPEIINLRYALVPYFEQYGVDVVLTGHDHAYSRSELLKGGAKEITYTDDEYEEQFDKDIDAGDDPVQVFESPANISSDTTDPAEQTYLEYLNTIMDSEAVVAATDNTDVAIDPEGILYMTAGSSSGSKYYDLVARQQTYIAARWQEDVPTYSVIDIDENSFTINTYRTDTNEPIDTQFTIVKSADKTALNEEIEKLEGLNLKAEDYTEESFSFYTAALEGAKKVAENAQATESEVSNALASLTAAYNALAPVSTDPATDPSTDPASEPASEGGASVSATDTTSGATAASSTVTSPKTGEGKAVVNTGDISFVVLASLIVAVCAAAVVIYSRARKKS